MKFGKYYFLNKDIGYFSFCQFCP